ncbi:amino acid adenylation domain-containing protein, partial [Streptomyces sp. NPDC052051]|uniref:amino acid adenylation domain-containing protein n=1 Tax=Streptomyces sp. NPDC052051 TaxID=3154649 RepID=UPI00342A3C4C
MLTEVGTTLVLTHEPTHTTVPQGPWHTLNIDTLPTPKATPSLSHALAHLPQRLDPDHACYVIFTSGSTGRPKGTTVTHANVTRLFEAVQQRLPFGPEDTWTLFHSYAFDFSVWEMWGALTTGARLVVVPYLTSRDAEAFYTLVRDQSVTMFSQTPSAFRQFEATDHTHRHDLALRAIVFGGEALDTPSVRRWTDRHAATPRLVNMYGITETTVHVTTHDIDTHQLDGNVTTIGRALPDLRLHVLDPYGNPTPLGVIGELHVGGAGLARGYTGQPALTAQRFVPDHLTPAPGARLYRSGDLARWTPSGDLEYLGRADAQVKIRGYRIELGEIEDQLARLDAIRQAVVVVRDDLGDRADLVAYLVPEPDTDQPTISELRDALADRLPGYMIPRNFVFLDALPLTPQGKLDQRALPQLTAERPELAAEFVAPLPGTEQLLATVWADILGVDRIGRHDNFFDLGGDSIRSIQVLGRARDHGLTLDLQDLFQHPTLADLATATTTAHPATTAPTTEPFSLLTPHDRNQLPPGLDDAYPMAELQIGMVYEMQRDPDRNPYLNVENLPVAGPFDAPLFRRAVALVVRRHPVLRTSLALTGYSKPLQLVHTDADVPLTVLDLRGLGDDAQRAALRECVRTERAKVFDTGAAPLFRMTVHVLSDDAFQWTVTDHHAILDGWSLASTLAEIIETYQALLDGHSPSLPPLRSTYRDYIAAEQDALTDPAHTAYWHTLLADRPDAHLRGDSVELTDEPGYRNVTTHLPPQLLAALEQGAAQAGVPLKAVLLAAHLRALGLATGSPDVITGLTANGRLEETDGAEVRGLFLNTVPFRFRVREGSWADLARAVFDTEREMLPHRRYPMAALQRELGGAPLFEVNFTYNSFPQFGALAEAGALAKEGPGNDVPGLAPTSFPFSVTLSRESVLGGMWMELEYDTAKLSADQVARLRDYHLRALEAVAADIEADVYGAPLLSEAEQALLDMLNYTTDARAAGRVPVHELLQRQAARTPDAIAIEDGETRISLARLDADSDRLARRLRRSGVRHGDLVGIFLRPGAAALTTFWAVWKAGAAFVPLDPGLPEHRLRSMLDQARPVVLITDDPKAAPSGHPLFDLSVLTHEAADADSSALPSVSTRDLAYVMFTSGTTGAPKGVMIEHGSLAAFAVGTPLARTRSLGAEKPLRVVTGTSAYISDFLLAQILMVLDGHTLCVLSEEQRRDPGHLVALAHDRERAPDVIDTTTAQLQLFVEQGLLDAPHPPRLLVLGGEACPPDLWAALAERSAIRVFNTYGPTEATVEATMARVTGDSGPVIGRPCANTRIHLLDAAGHEVPPGTAGEICVGGIGVGRGYLDRPGVTAERFVPDPWGPAGSRLYRTGDVGRLTDSGDLEFLGRVDHQLKVRGERVEPEEVEAVLRAHPGVAAAIVGRHPDHEGLLANVVPAEGGAPDQRELRRHAASRLSAAAVPTHFVVVDAVPLTPAGKLDRRALSTSGPGSHPAGAPEGIGGPGEPGPGAAESAFSRTERRVAEVWHKVLGVHADRRDDFFAIGGHSLLAVRLAGELGAAFGTTVPLPQLYSTPTLAGQAAFLDDARHAREAKRRGSGPRSVIGLGGSPGLQPLVLVHPLGGTLFCYRDLTARVADSFEVMGVQGDLMSGGDTADFASLASGYARELAPLLRGRRPVIAGWSAGGVLAHEVAARLADRGIVADRVVVVDAAPQQGPDVAADVAALERLRADVGRLGPRRLLAEHAIDDVLRLLGVDAEALAELNGPVTASLMEFWHGMLSGLAGHRPSSYAGPVHLVVSRQGEESAVRAAITGWRRFAGTLRVSYADGDHYQLLREPWIGDVAEAFTAPDDPTGRGDGDASHRS